MIVAQTVSKIDIYSINQIIDILLYSWICLIMVKRTVCNSFEPPITLSNIFKYRHFISDGILLVASLIAICVFGDQLYSHIINSKDHHDLLSHTFIWMLFHKLITISLLIKYKNSQPKIFHIIKQELIYVKQLLFK